MRIYLLQIYANISPTEIKNQNFKYYLNKMLLTVDNKTNISNSNYNFPHTYVFLHYDQYATL